MVKISEEQFLTLHQVVYFAKRNREREGETLSEPAKLTFGLEVIFHRNISFESETASFIWKLIFQYLIVVKTLGWELLYTEPQLRPWSILGELLKTIQ